MDGVALHSTTHRRLRVLVAAADGEARRQYIAALGPLHCDAIEAADGREALVAALVGRPTLIVMESRLPLVNGAALCEVLRRDAQTRTVPIVALATDPAEREVDKIRRAGANAILVKPVAPDLLVSELRRLAAAEPSAIQTPPPLPEPPLADDARPRKRMTNSKMHIRCTTTNPPALPPALRCPSCDGPLLYERSHVGGVSHRQPEQWDDYLCPACGTFEYRHRTRKLREVVADR